MSGFQPDERVKVSFAARIVEDDDLGPVTVADENGDEYQLPPGASIERVAPAEYPQPGEIWADGDDALWFAQRHYADFDDLEDSKGVNGEGWRVVLVPLNGGPYGGEPGRVELVERIGWEIIRRWLKGVPPELYHHQGSHYEKKWLTTFAKYQPGGPNGTPEWKNGTWVLKDTAPTEDGDGRG